MLIAFNHIELLHTVPFFVEMANNDSKEHLSDENRVQGHRQNKIESRETRQGCIHLVQHCKVTHVDLQQLVYGAN